MGNQNKQLAFLFPGQGSQRMQMLHAIGEVLPIVQETFTQASQVLGKDLWRLAQLGPLEVLNETSHTQPLLLVSGVALWRAWLSRKGALPAWLAGHSLGEYTALVCAEAMSLEDAVQLVALRGELMQAAVPQGKGAMAAVLGLEAPLLAVLCEQVSKENRVVSCANYNAPGQIVVAGEKQAVEEVLILAKEKGAKRSILLPVSVPSHCALMHSVARAFTQAVEKTPIHTPRIPVLHNVTVDCCIHPDDIRAVLVSQLAAPVRWMETVMRLAKEGVRTVIECGPGKVLCGLVKRTERSMDAMSIEEVAEFERALLLDAEIR